VLINNPSRNPIPAARIQSINKLVSSAVGSGENRHVTVVDLPFTDADAGAGETNPPWWRQQWLTAAAQNAMLGFAGLLVVAGGVLPLLRRSRANLARISDQKAAAEGARETAHRGVESRAEPSMRSIAGTRHAAVIDADAVRAMAANDPARTAQVIKEWIARDRSSVRRTG
jgi:flagellar M-ring protein FliF